MWRADAEALAAALALPVSPHSLACVQCMAGQGADRLQTVEVAVVPGSGQVRGQTPNRQGAAWQLLSGALWAMIGAVRWRGRADRHQQVRRDRPTLASA